MESSKNTNFLSNPFGSVSNPFGILLNKIKGFRKHKNSQKKI